MDTIVLKKDSHSDLIPFTGKSKIILNSRKGMHYKITMSNSSGTKKSAYHISEPTEIDLKKEKLPFVVSFIRFDTFTHTC